MIEERDFIRRLYQSCLQISDNHYRNWAIKFLRELIYFDAALWCRGDLKTGELRSMTLTALPQNYSAAFSQMRRHDVVYTESLREPGEVFDLETVFSDKKAREMSQIAQRLLQPFGIHKQIGCSQVDHELDAFSCFQLYRSDNGERFSAADKALFSSATFHMVGAATHAFFVHSAKPGAPYWYAATGLCDEDGNLLECQAQLTRLLAHQFPGWKGKRLPFDIALKSAPATISVGNLEVHVEPRTAHFLVRVIEKNPFDRLSKREREVALAVGSGLSYKAVGRQLSLSESTVANHLNRAFRKLGVNNRTQLAELILAYGNA